MIKILIATHNKNKKKEVKNILKKFTNIRIIDLSSLKVKTPIIVEDGKTFRQNAVKKAVITSMFFDGYVLADDSGLEVEALNGRPGVRSARFARKEATDQENNTKLLKLLDKVTKRKRKARFVCCLAFAKQGLLLETFEGIVEGEIAFKEKGTNGFGYDSIFIPKKHGKSFAEMTETYKNRISHRGNALKKFKDNIKKHINKK